MGFFTSLKDKLTEATHSSSSHHDEDQGSSMPPAWAPAPEISHQYGKWNEAPEEEYDAAEAFCSEYPVQPPRLLPSNAIDAITNLGCKAWGIEYPTSPRFAGTIRNPDDKKGSSAGVCTVQTNKKCKDTCLLSSLPILAGLYDIQGKTGVYFEVQIHRMDGIIAVGTACRPYPAWRLPGWNRLSAGFHLDDFRKFFEDPDGGRDYIPETNSSPLTSIKPQDTIGLGFIFSSGTLFYTYNGVRLPDAFQGIYLPRQEHDVFAAIGVEGECEFEVNFGGDVFRWKEANEWAWRVEGHVGKTNGSSQGGDDELPSYQALT
ncbi:endosome protein [Crepidotus variabilis]|uniref:Endosome protein n=1 Tax=Crepidotus variabilis TaxID=179855 RepID=A0A9P6JM92_9AGAR|nr:endosome protein [Crepidotus variabilis]